MAGVRILKCRIRAGGGTGAFLAASSGAAGAGEAALAGQIKARAAAVRIAGTKGTLVLIKGEGEFEMDIGSTWQAVQIPYVRPNYDGFAKIGNPSVNRGRKVQHLWFNQEDVHRHVSTGHSGTWFLCPLLTDNKP